MKKVINILKTAFIIALCASCNDWFDVKPRDMEEADKLFSTQDGFKEALAGVYTNLCQTSAYGREMTYGLVSVFGQEWARGSGIDNQPASLYALARSFRYEETNVQSSIDRFWSVLYNTIAQANTLIYYTEVKREALNDLNYHIIRGEAFALRAFAHSEIFRLYADVQGMAPDDDHIALPYVSSTIPAITPQSTNKEFYDYLMADIAEALRLLEVDPIVSGEDMRGVDNGYLVNRHYHLNYYAVWALKARMCLYYGRKSDALQAARTVLSAQSEKGLFPWVTRDDANNTNTNMRDRTFSTEHIFALNITELETYIRGYFRETVTPLEARIEKGTLYPYGGDLRAIFFESYNGVPDVYSRFWQMSTSSRRDRMPIIRITEMFYIAAECLIGSNNQEAISLLQQVRTGRNIVEEISTDLNDDLIRAEILAEYQREFLGEGQLFYYHKRMKDTRIGTVTADYILPLPTTEWDLGDRTPVKKTDD